MKSSGQPNEVFYPV